VKLLITNGVCAADMLMIPKVIIIYLEQLAIFFPGTQGCAS